MCVLWHGMTRCPVAAFVGAHCCSAVNITSNVHTLAASWTCFPHVFAFSETLTLHNAPILYWLCLGHNFVFPYNDRTQSLPLKFLLVLICNMSTEYFLARQPGCPALPMSTVKLEHAVSWHIDQCQHCHQMYRGSSSVCQYCCAEALGGSQLNTSVRVPFVSTRQTPHVCLRSLPSPVCERVQISPLLLRHLCLHLTPATIPLWCEKEDLRQRWYYNWAQRQHLIPICCQGLP